ncbi:MAG: RluA family pseudouridine synthase [bacterium]|nr:RluA family pseudouridine synthase [bacterium]
MSIKTSEKHDNVKVLYEEKDFIIIHKPAGLLTHGTHQKNWKAPTPRGVGVPTASVGREKEKTLADWLRKEYPETRAIGDNPKERPGIVHRLDKDTSGVLLVARTQSFFEYFKKLLGERKVKKTYLALVYGKVEKGQTIEKPIGLISGSTKRSTRAKAMKMVKEAVTEIEPVQTLHCKKLFPERPRRGGGVEGLQSADEVFTLLKAYPKTGRTHQIRVHLASIGHPVVGDKLYGGKRPTLGLERHFLHASSLEFSTSDGRRIKVEAELPQNLLEVLQTLISKP